MDRRKFLEALGIGAAGVATAKLDPLFTPSIEKQIQEIKDVLTNGLNLTLTINGVPYNSQVANEQRSKHELFWNLDEQLNKKFSYMSLNSNLSKQYYLEVLDQVKQLDNMGGERGYEYYKITNNNTLLADVYYNLGMINDAYYMLERGIDKNISIWTKSNILKEAGDWCYEKNKLNKALKYYQAGLKLNKNLSVKRKIKSILEQKSS